MSSTNVLTQTGNRVVVEIDGNEVGLCQSARGSDDYGLEPASGIGDIHTKENVPTRANHSVSVSTMVLMRGNLSSLGVISENGDAALQGLVFDICFYSKDTGALLKKYVNCSYASGDIEVSAHRIIMKSAQFRALDVQGTGL